MISRRWLDSEREHLGGYIIASADYYPPRDDSGFWHKSGLVVIEDHNGGKVEFSIVQMKGAPRDSNLTALMVIREEIEKVIEFLIGGRNDEQEPSE